MKEHFDKIRELLDQFETSSLSVQLDSIDRNFDALELPEIICQIVDFLQPHLLPYEAVIYWHLFRHSVASYGTQHVRVSVNRLCGGVVTSSRSQQSTTLSQTAVREALQGLENKGAIRKAGDTNREGTLYFVALPEEIPSCAERMKAAEDGREKPKPVDEKREVDFYNVSENRLRIFERDGYKCYRCGKQLTRFSATLDHIQPISKGGDNSYSNLVTCCLHDNSRRGSRPIMDPLKTEA
jgi:hypothetical protein